MDRINQLLNSQAFKDSVALHQQGHLAEAKEGYLQLSQSYPNAPPLLTALGTLALQTGDIPEGVRLIEQSLSLYPQQPSALSNVANGLSAIGRKAEALEKYEQAIALFPDYTDAHYNRGNLLLESRRYAEALASYDRALEIQPDYVLAHYNRALALKELGRFQESLASNDAAIALKPDYAEAYWNKALTHLLLGDYSTGWRLYEWRWQRESGSASRQTYKNLPRPLWLGETPLAGKTLLVTCEQGLGDMIQFCRFLPIVARQARMVMVETPPSLLPLLQTLEGNFQWIPEGGEVPDFDLHCPLMSLPLALGIRLETVPAESPYLHVNPERQSLWRARLGPAAGGRIGLAWSGSSRHDHDYKRSLCLDQLRPLLQLPLDFHVLQKDIRAEDESLLSEFPNLTLHRDQLHDFADAAALTEAMDLVISVDTSIAHLSGALDKPVWVLLPQVPDFRWLLDRPDSPWYPTARLFRQPERGAWDAVIHDVQVSLKRWLDEHVSG
jgi:tetratricopeptide (TPR) repeat protein